MFPLQLVVVLEFSPQFAKFNGSVVQTRAREWEINRDDEMNSFRGTNAETGRRFNGLPHVLPVLMQTAREFPQWAEEARHPDLSPGTTDVS